MSLVHGYEFPEELYYDIETGAWVRLESDGCITVGLTGWAMDRVGEPVLCSLKRTGKQIRPGKSCATIECADWVGPAPCPVGGEVVEVNDAVTERPVLLIEQPYGDGWLVRLQPEDWLGESDGLLTGAAALHAFTARIEAEQAEQALLEMEPAPASGDGSTPA